MLFLEQIVSVIFAVGLFINALLFIPQALKIARNKKAKNLSLLTFLGFCATQASAVLYGYFKKDSLLIFGYMLALLTCGTVTTLIFMYRNN